MSEVSNSRRQFLRRAAGTFAAGAGLALATTNTAAGASVPRDAGAGIDVKGGAAEYPPPRRGVKLQDPNVCGIQCQPISCPGGCGAGRNYFRCFGCGYNYSQCYTHSCTTFCDCVGCC